MGSSPTALGVIWPQDGQYDWPATRQKGTSLTFRESSHIIGGDANEAYVGFGVGPAGVFSEPSVFQMKPK